MSRDVRKRAVEYVRPAKIQINLRIRAVWSESPLPAFWIAKDAKFLQTLCLCWGFTAQSTQWGHVERGQFT